MCTDSTNFLRPKMLTHFLWVFSVKSEQAFPNRLQWGSSIQRAWGAVSKNSCWSKNRLLTGLIYICMSQRSVGIHSVNPFLWRLFLSHDSSIITWFIQHLAAKIDNNQWTTESVDLNYFLNFMVWLCLLSCLCFWQCLFIWKLLLLLYGLLILSPALLIDMN